MPAQQANLALDGLKSEIQPALKALADQLNTGLGGNLQSITVIGSALTGDYVSGKSDINTVVVLKTLELDALNAVRNMAKPMAKRKVSAPLLMTAQYIQRSLDVFGVEFLQFQLVHKTIYGEDPFANLSIAKEDVRLQCERELKASLIRLRQGYIAAAGRKNLVRDVLASTAKNLVPLLQAMLWLKGSERPAEAQSVLQKSAQEFSIAAEMLVAACKWRYEKPRLAEDELENAFESIYSTIDQLAAMADKLEVQA